MLFARGGASDQLFFLERGTIDMLVPPHLNHLNHASSNNDLRHAASPSAARLTTGHHSGWRRIQRISGGGIAGECGFFLQVVQPFTAVARAASCVWVVDRGAFDAMARDQPHVCILVRKPEIERAPRIGLFETPPNNVHDLAPLLLHLLLVFAPCSSSCVCCMPIAEYRTLVIHVTGSNGAS